MRIFSGPARLAEEAGTEIGRSEWIEINQDRVARFAEATGDHQWIHVDAARAATGPFGSTIAHGLLTLSLLPMLTRSIYRVDGILMGLNYGYNKVRFTNPVRVGSRLRACVFLLAVTDVPEGKQATTRVTAEIDGVGKPACIAEHVVRYVL